jgi:hypothetical protein
MVIKECMHMSWSFVLNDLRREVVVCSVDISVIVDCELSFHNLIVWS